MEYQVLYDAWIREKTSIELQPLSKAFYAEASAFIRAKKEEAHMFDEHSLRGHLLRVELAMLSRILSDLVELRLKKTLQTIFEGKRPKPEFVPYEEESMIQRILTVKDQFELLLKSVLEGRLQATSGGGGLNQKRVLVRFLQNIPAIVGSDTAVYGPFKTEDIAALPMENAESLIKRGVAVRVEQ
ncbi:MAG: hypothetical protein QXI32_02845 [Candidatus Bathyarchaeia archaeon]